MTDAHRQPLYFQLFRTLGNRLNAPIQNTIERFAHLVRTWRANLHIRICNSTFIPRSMLITCSRSRDVSGIDQLPLLLMIIND